MFDVIHYIKQDQNFILTFTFIDHIVNKKIQTERIIDNPSYNQGMIPLHAF